MTKAPLNRTTWNKGLKTGPLSEEHKQKIIDTNYTNNKFDNLCVMSRSDHAKLHFGGFE